MTSIAAGPTRPLTRAAAPVWLPPVAFGLTMLALLLLGRPSLVRLAFPAGGLLVGLWLFRQGVGPYLIFGWALWMVTPGIRRIVDFQLGGLEPQNPMSLTPFIVSGIGMLAALRRFPAVVRGGYLPWFAVGVCILYGYFVGTLKLGLMPATHALISWLVPLGFGLHGALEWRRYPELAGAYRQAFLWGTIVLGGYGILQFIDPPAWDRLWMMDSGMYSIGRAFPYEVRVFSLVNAPLPFATVLVAGLFVALSGRGLLRMVALAVGTVALLLSLVRSVWLAGLLGLLVYAVALPLRSLKRVVLASLATGAIVVAASSLAPREVAEPTLQILSTRFATLGDLSRDVSLRDRTLFLDDIAGTVAENPEGQGLGSTGVSSMLADAGSGIRDFDNGLFAVWYSLGWVGGSVLLLATLTIVGRLFIRRRSLVGPDPMDRVARAVVVTSLILIVGANVMEGVSAAVLWGFAGLATASYRYRLAMEGS